MCSNVNSSRTQIKVQRTCLSSSTVHRHQINQFLVDLFVDLFTVRKITNTIQTRAAKNKPIHWLMGLRVSGGDSQTPIHPSLSITITPSTLLHPLLLNQRGVMTAWIWLKARTGTNTHTRTLWPLCTVGCEWPLGRRRCVNGVICPMADALIRSQNGAETRERCSH